MVVYRLLRNIILAVVIFLAGFWLGRTYEYMVWVGKIVQDMNSGR